MDLAHADRRLHVDGAVHTRMVMVVVHVDGVECELLHRWHRLGVLQLLVIKALHATILMEACVAFGKVLVVRRGELRDVSLVELGCECMLLGVTGDESVLGQLGRVLQRTVAESMLALVLNL